MAGGVTNRPHARSPYSTDQSLTDRFDKFFVAELPRLVGYCAGLVGSRDEGADIAQEALVRTFARWVSVREPHAYVYLVATNLIRASWRRERRQRHALTMLSRRPTVESSSDLSLRDLVDRLPETQRVAVLLHYYADLPIETVARLLNRPSGTVRRHLHEARSFLAVELRKDHSDD